ncbi:hypothetical protein HN51_041955 [Arachis hypogaea]
MRGFCKPVSGVLEDFVEIESQDKVQLSVSSDTDIGTIYSVTVPVRRVKPEYQDMDEVGTITNIEFKETGDISGSSLDVRFDFFVPDERLVKPNSSIIVTLDYNHVSDSDMVLIHIHKSTKLFAPQPSDLESDVLPLRHGSTGCKDLHV